MMQPTFIKTSKGFINLAQVEITELDKDGHFWVFTASDRFRLVFTGLEAEALNKIFNTITIFDATKEESK